jgi:hypothetical protein
MTAAVPFPAPGGAAAALPRHRRGALSSSVSKQNSSLPKSNSIVNRSSARRLSAPSSSAAAGVSHHHYPRLRAYRRAGIVAAGVSGDSAGDSAGPSSSSSSSAARDNDDAFFCSDVTRAVLAFHAAEGNGNGRVAPTPGCQNGHMHNTARHPLVSPSIRPTMAVTPTPGCLFRDWMCFDAQQ